MTAGGEAVVREMADLYLGDYELLDGYVNDNMVTSLLCEGDLARNHGWQFLSAGNKKLCMTPQGNFVAARHGNLHFWPVEMGGLHRDRMQVAQMKARHGQKELLLVVRIPEEWFLLLGVIVQL